jgi:flagellar hook assembly protein FlgD
MKAYNWPNPFKPERDRLTTLTFFLPEGRAARLRLLDAGGDLVKQWDLPNAPAGMNLVVWDGRNGVGQAVAVGAYTLVVESGGQRALAQVAVLR